MTPYYDEGGITIYHGRCETIVPQLDPIDLVFTSPPYNKGADGDDHFGHYRDGQERGGYGKWDGTAGGGIDYGDHDDAGTNDVGV